MNKNSFRIIFNKRRGQLMAVAETSASQGKVASGESRTSGTNTLSDHAVQALNALSFAMLCALGAVLWVLPTPNVHAQVVVYRNAPANQQPTILQTANGLPQINIQTPSAAGVSHNVYSQFDVQSNGVILNNSRTNVQTQQGGWVQGNPWLATGSARVILNEVNASSPSQLNGYVEVAGQRAEVVIANPAGISVNGGGFINTSKATLTTGTAIVNGGNLDGYRVQGGNISINGNGLDLSTTDYAAILARAVQVNAGIWANELKVVTGANQIDANSLAANTTPVTTPIAGTGAVPSFALDVAQIGGMYAGKIHLIGTEQGLGVRSAGTLGATGGDLVLQNNGWLTNSGLMQASKALQIQMSEGIDNQATGQMLATETASLNSSTLTNRGLIDSASTQITASGNLINIGTGRLYGDVLGIQAGTLLNDAETINGQTTAATIAARQQLDIGIQTLTNTNNALIYSGGDMAMGGSLDANRKTTGAAQTIVNNGSTIESANNLQLNAQDIQNLNRDFAYHVDTILNASSGKEYVTSVGIVPADQTVILNQASSWLVRGHEGSLAYLWSPGTYLYVLSPNSIYNTAAYRALFTGSDVVTFQTEPATGILQPSTFSVAGVSDPATWQLLGLTKPINPPPSGARPTDSMAQQTWDAAAAPYVALQNKITALRSTMNAEGVRVQNWVDFQTDEQVLTVTKSNPGKIISGADMSLHAGRALLNDMSQIVAGGNITITGAQVENRQRTEPTVNIRHGTNYNWQHKDYGCGNDIRGCDWELDAYWTRSYNLPINKTTTLALASTQQNQTLSHNIQISQSSLYRVPTDPAANYLIETDPRFINNKLWLGSDYLTRYLSLDPTVTQKRLGDGFYEQKLIREQVAELTGRRFLDDYSSDEQEYQALMDNGMTFASQYNLRLGIALSNAQVAQLTSDIVWLVEKTITLPDGRMQKALVPQLYVKPKAGDLTADGALISGQNLTMKLSGDLNNGGTIAGRKVVSLAANNISNLNVMRGDQVVLDAQTNIDVLGGHVQAQSSLTAQAGRDINVSSTLHQGASADGSVAMQGIERVAGLYVTGSNGQLSLNAGKDINLTAANVVNAGSGATTLSAGHAVKLQTLTESQRIDTVVEEGKQYSKASQSKEVGSTVSGGGQVSVTAKDIQARAATLEAGNTLNLTATHNINLEAGLATQNFSVAEKQTSHGGVLGSDSETITKRVSNSTTAQASNVGGKDVQINAGNDIGIKGSNVIGDNATSLTAQNNLTIEAAQNTQIQGYSQQTIEKGFLSGGGIGISYGERKQSLDNQSTTTTAAASTVGSVGGNVSIIAGNQYKQVGSDVVAPGGDISIQAKTVGIQEARETNQQSTEQKFEQSGVTLALNSTVVSTVQNAQNQIKATTQTSDSRMKTLGAASAAANVKMAADALKAGQGDANEMVKGADGKMVEGNVADKAGGISVSLSYGTSSSQSNSASTSDTARGSTVKAAGNVYMAATGGGANSSLIIQGSDVSGQTVALAADHEVAFLAASNTSTQTSSSSNNSASVGVAAQLGNGGGGMGVTGSVSQGKGSGNGTETTYINTHISGTDRVTIQSGGDTTLKGATVEDKQITTNIGGNLNIESLQDTATYAEKNQQAGASVMIGTNTSGNLNYAKSNINSNYASVTEQSGIKAGDGGFTVNVQGNTDLKGGAITSTQAAIDQNKNTFSTGGTLTTSDIQNKANYNASSVSVSVGVGSTPLPGQGLSSTLTGAGMGKDSGSASSTTKAGISGVAGDSSKRTGDNAQGLAKIFDVDKVRQEIQAQTQITQEFAKQASSTIQSYSNQQKKDLQAQMKTASDADKPALKQQLDQVLLEEKVLNILVGAVTGFGETMVTKESLAMAAEQMRQAVAEDSAKFKGAVDKDGNPLFSNQSGESAGIDGDGKKYAGTRADLDRLCGVDNNRCKTNPDNSLALTGKGEVQFVGAEKPDKTRETYAEFLQTEDGKKMTSAPFGGQQGSERTWLFGEYPKGGIVDKLLEAFAGPHDTIGGKSSGLYDDLGNTTRGRSDVTKAAHEIWSGVALIPAAPFAAAKELPSEVWKAIGILLKWGQ